MFKNKFSNFNEHRNINLQVRKHFSVIHNFHSPASLWITGREYKYDDNLEEYNIYIQAFLNKRFTNKKEIPPKIKVLKDMNNILKEYHNSFYVQLTYPSYNLFDIDYLKYMNSHKIIDSGYIISRFFEEYEKPMYDAVLSKLLVNGRVEFMEDKEFFDKNRVEINRLIKIFYEGDELSNFEREIERAYLILKQSKSYELQCRYANNPKLKKEECFLSFSEVNKISGHLNFRMHHPEYFFRACPIFERINVKNMFNALYEIRYNSLSKHQIFQKLKLKYLYRNSLLKSGHRVQYLAYYIYLRIFQYMESYEYNNEFNLSLNFKANFNMIVFHTWLIIQRLQTIINTNEDVNNTKYSKFLIGELTDKIVNYFDQNLGNFQFSHRDSLKNIDANKFVHKLFDFFTWNFYVINKENPFNNIKNFINEIIFENSKNKNDQNLKKYCYYSLYHLGYMNSVSYEEIEKTDFDFSTNNIPINAHEYINTNDLASDKVKSYSDYLFKIEQMDVNKFLRNYQENEFLFFVKFNKKIKPESNADNFKLFQELSENYGVNPYKDKSNFFAYDVEKSVGTKFNNFMKNEMIFESAIAHEKVKFKI